MTTPALTPIKVKDLPAFLTAIEPIARELERGDLLAAIARHAEAVITATAIGAGVERAWLEEQTPDVLVDLAAQVLEANADFFVRHVLPTVERAAKVMAAIVSGGTSGSPASSPAASATGT